MRKCLAEATVNGRHLEIGDQVHLKTRDDIKMVVDDITHDSTFIPVRHLVTCVWFDYSGLKRGTFDERCLAKG